VLSPIDLSADPGFRGDPQRCNPEQLLVLAAASCQLLSFLAVAARARIDVRRYDDEAEGVMPENIKPIRLTAIRLRPTITVGPGHSRERLAHLVQLAHRECYIANSLTCRSPSSRASKCWTTPSGRARSDEPPEELDRLG
jgi:organic hydroperoxide reductase OsmC/OhrA